MRPHETHPGEIRARAAVDFGDKVPAQVYNDIAQEIHLCCGHSQLKSHRLARGWSPQDAVDRLIEVAASEGLPARGVEVRALRRWESGGHADADYQDRLARLYETGPVQLGFATDYTPPSGGDRTNRRDALRGAARLGAAALIAPGLLATAEQEARELTRRSEETDLGPSSLAHLQRVITDYGLHYARYSADELWEAALGDRRHVSTLLQHRTTLRQRRELYVAAAWLSLVLAWAAGDRGQVRASLAFAADARHHADEADHPEAVAWAWDVEATTWLYNDQPDEALRAAQHGVAVAPAGTAAQTRLTGQVARVHARLGHVGPASEMLTVLRGHAERHAAHATGLFSADAARVWSVAATSCLWLGDAGQARDFALQAMDVYEQDPSMSPTRRAITALDLGTASAQLGDPEQAVIHGLDALATPRHAAAIVTRCFSLHSMLERNFPGAAVVGRFRQSVAELSGG
ncbi:hypothetical protein ABT158_03830 [Nonomuraea sp. NPDC001636]|uniref:hypothetical protein n=1 Tax=Nonomuraea sp. NPDC001636 TaxID=3154391 RepID=UPI003324CDEE